MKRLFAWLAAIATIAVMSPSMAMAGPADALVGSWTFLVNEAVRPDGTHVDTYGKQPRGLLMFDAGGHFSLVITDPDRPRFASDNRLTGTTDENAAAVHGSIAYFGTYGVDADGKVLTLSLRASTYPNWNGFVQKRPFAIHGDELSFTNPVGSRAGAFRIVLRKAS